MNFDHYRKQFEEKAENAGYSYDEIIKCLEYARPILENGVPIIYNTSHLSALVGYDKNYLKRAALSTKFFYREFKILKKNGKFRIISEPLPSLKEIQHWILNEILYKINVSKYAKAYIPGRTIKEHIRFHKNKHIVLTVDIKDFFGSIKMKSVEDVFKELGYSEFIYNLLAKLCCLRNSLPQGAPTSPYLSNIICEEMDNEIAAYCMGGEIKFSRYADDMAFSGEFDHIMLERELRKILKKHGFTINKSKTRLMKQNQPQIIAGVLVNKKFQVPRKQRDELRQAVYYIEKFGLESHLDKIKCQKSSYIEHLLGIANYMLFLNPKDQKVKEYKSILYKYVQD
jgi:RNA-directed DNA polymerase